LKNPGVVDDDLSLQFKKWDKTDSEEGMMISALQKKNLAKPHKENAVAESRGQTTGSPDGTWTPITKTSKMLGRAKPKEKKRNCKWSRARKK